MLIIPSQYCVWALTFGAETGAFQVEDALQQGEFLQDDAKAVDVTLLCSTCRWVVGTQKLGGRPQLAYKRKHWCNRLLHTHSDSMCCHSTHVHRKHAHPPSCSPCGKFPDRNLWSSARSGCPPRSWKTSGCHGRQWRCCEWTPFPEWWKDDTLTKTSDSIHRIYQHHTMKILITDSLATAICFPESQFASQGIDILIIPFKLHTSHPNIMSHQEQYFKKCTAVHSRFKQLF